MAALRATSHVRVQDFHKEMRSQLLAEQRAAVESERHAATLRLQAKQEEIELLKDDLSVTCAAAAAAEVRVQRSCDHIARLNERWRDRRYMASYFKTWAEGWRWEKRDKRGEAKAVRWYAAAGCCLPQARGPLHWPIPTIHQASLPSYPASYWILQPVCCYLSAMRLDYMAWPGERALLH